MGHIIRAHVLLTTLKYPKWKQNINASFPLQITVCHKTLKSIQHVGYIWFEDMAQRNDAQPTSRHNIVFLKVRTMFE